MRQLRRAQREQIRLPAYVVSVGNLVAGGTGKTPFAIWIAQFYRALGKQPAVLSRGYGGRSKTVSQVPTSDETLPPFLEFGDEPVLMAHKMPGIPVWTGRRRSSAGLAAIEKSAAEVLVLDDGFQHLALHRDLDVVLLDSRNPFGNSSLIPLGPLREPIDHLQRADIIILTRADASSQTTETLELIRRRFPDKPVFCCRHCLKHFTWGLAGPQIPLTALQGRKLVAFAGIARPDSFFASLSDSKLHLAAQVAFPDHYAFRLADLLTLLEMLGQKDADFLITTEKDAVRLPADFRRLVLTVHLELDFGRDRQPLMLVLEEHLRLFDGAARPPENQGAISTK